GAAASEVGARQAEAGRRVDSLDLQRVHDLARHRRGAGGAQPPGGRSGRRAARAAAAGLRHHGFPPRERGDPGRARRGRAHGTAHRASDRLTRRGNLAARDARGARGGGGPMIVALMGAVAFNEILSLEEISGVALICAGILGFASGSHDRRATWFAVANAVVIAAYTLVDGQGARASGAPVSYTLWFFI